jgi:hypothetical protein
MGGPPPMMGPPMGGPPMMGPPMGGPPPMMPSYGQVGIPVRAVPPKSNLWIWILGGVVVVGGIVGGAVVATNRNKGDDTAELGSRNGSADDDDDDDDQPDPWAAGPDPAPAPAPAPTPYPAPEPEPAPVPAPVPTITVDGDVFTHPHGWTVVLPPGVVQDPTAKEPFTSFASPDVSTLIVIASLQIDSTSETDAQMKQGAADLAKGFNGKLINADFTKVQGARRLRAVIEAGQIRLEAVAFLQPGLTVVAMYGVPTARYNGAALERREFFEHRLMMPGAATP